LGRSRVGKVAAGYTEVNWDNISLAADPRSFLLSLAHRMKYLPIDPDCAVAMMENEGPNFGLGAYHISMGDQLNAEGQSNCACNTEVYRIPADDLGNSYLTGEKDKFTCTALETYLIQY
jgi:hypothetical protein